MMKYKFNLSETNFIKFDEEKLNGFKDITLSFDDDPTIKKAKLVYIKRYDGKEYYIIMPLDMLEKIAEGER